ncbi:MAG: ACT domain-containing protein [Pseudomonadota bacterium]
MSGETNLDNLLQSMKPDLLAAEYVFCTFASAVYGENSGLNPIASFQEAEGLTLVIPKCAADEKGLDYDQVFRCITLQIHSSLDAIGLTAAVATQLTEQQISANVIAGYFHDHIFVPTDRAEAALEALHKLCH